MRDFDTLKQETARMSEAALKMLEIMHSAFMEHDTDLISLALDEEKKLNEQEKSITSGLVELGRTLAKKEERQRAVIYADVAGDLELIGDYCKDILERVQIKIEEKLLFSDDAVKEYNELYALAEKALKEVVSALKEDNLKSLKEVLKKEEHIDGLVDELRKKHNQRLIDGVCVPIACNMFLNMLDFTAAIYYPIKKIARNLSKIK